MKYGHIPSDRGAAFVSFLFVSLALRPRRTYIREGAFGAR